jgi:hypothetical protein
LKGKFEKYVKIVDPFVVTMILFTQEDFILQTLEGLGLFDECTKYVVFSDEHLIWERKSLVLDYFEKSKVSRPQSTNLSAII